MMRRKRPTKIVHKSIDGIIPPTTAQGSFKVTIRSFIAATLLVLLGIAIGGLGYRLMLDGNRIAQNNRLPNNATVQEVIDAVSTLYVLPSDEKPALATVTDKTKLTSQFFKHTQNGDRVLIYQNNRIAIVYRPSINRIVSVGPVTIDTPAVKQQ